MGEVVADEAVGVGRWASRLEQASPFEISSEGA